MQNVVADVRKSNTDVVLMDVDTLMQTGFKDDEKNICVCLHRRIGDILKKSPPAQLLQAIEDVHRGDAASIAKRVLAAFQKNVFIENNEEIILTPREREILSFFSKRI